MRQLSEAFRVRFLILEYRVRDEQIWLIIKLLEMKMCLLAEEEKENEESSFAFFNRKIDDHFSLLSSDTSIQ